VREFVIPLEEVPEPGDTLSHPPPFDVEAVACQLNATWPPLPINTVCAGGLAVPATVRNPSGVVSTRKDAGVRP
jgi:hypothetical protein